MGNFKKILEKSNETWRKKINPLDVETFLIDYFTILDELKVDIVDAECNFRVIDDEDEQAGYDKVDPNIYRKAMLFQDIEDKSRFARIMFIICKQRGEEHLCMRMTGTGHTGSAVQETTPTPRDMSVGLKKLLLHINEWI